MPAIQIVSNIAGDAWYSIGQATYSKDWDATGYLGPGYDPNGKIRARSAYHFSLAELPSAKEIVITRVRFGVGVSQAGGGAGVWGLRGYNGNGQAYPCDDDAQTMYNRCATGTIYLSTTDWRQVGYYWHVLGDGENAQACMDVANAKDAVNRFSVAMAEQGDNDAMPGLTPSNSLDPTLEITYEYRYNQGHFRWYRNGWQDQDVQVMDVQNADALQFRICLHELLSAARSNLDIDVEFREEGAIWQTLGAQGATDKAWRWRDDPTLTEHQAIDQARLSCTTQNGLVHENACQNSENIGANAHYEICIVLEPYSAVVGKTYEFVVNVEGKRLRLDAEVASFVKCTMYSSPVVGYQYSDGLVSIQVV